MCGANPFDIQYVTEILEHGGPRPWCIIAEIRKSKHWIRTWSEQHFQVAFLQHSANGVLGGFLVHVVGVYLHLPVFNEYTKDHVGSAHQLILYLITHSNVPHNRIQNQSTVPSREGPNNRSKGIPRHDPATQLIVHLQSTPHRTQS